MSKQRIIKDEVWDDEWFFKLNTCEKLVWLFLLTNPRSNIAGVYKLNSSLAAATLGYTVSKFNNILKKFVEQKKIVVKDGWIVIWNFHKHQSNNPKVEKGVIRIISELPQEIRDLLPMDSLCIAYRTLLNSTLLYSTSLISNGADAPIEENMGWKQYNENKHSDDLPVVDSESGEVVDPDAKDASKNKELTEKKNKAINWLIEYQGRDVLRTNRPKQMKALNEILKMNVSLREAADMVKEQMESEYWKGKQEKPDFSTVAAIIQKRG